jgi:ribosomal protein S18 acetylase RimI-like enzyme
VILPSRELMPVIRAALERGQRVRLTANGSSMTPFIRDGDVVELEPLHAAWTLGDIVLAESAAEHYVIHRIVRLVGDRVWLRGDAQAQREGPVPRQAVLGRAVTASRNGRVRALDRGWRRLAGRVWVLCAPLGVWLLRLIGFARRVGGWALRGLQRIPLFRAWVKRFRPAFVIQEASQSDLMALYAWLHPNGESTLPASERNANPNLTNYVAKNGSETLGLVRLVRHPEADFPHVGYWLYSLTIRPRYRGMGIGEALTRRVIEQAQAEGARELFLRVFEDNTPALALYGKLGFAPVTLPALDEDLAADAQKDEYTAKVSAILLSF